MSEVTEDETAGKPSVPPERQQPPYQAIGSELIALTPESWQAIVLRVSVNRPENGMLGMTHEISSPEGHKEPITPSDELSDLTYSLLKLFEEFGPAWKQLTFKVTMQSDGGWRFQSDFQYE